MVGTSAIASDAGSEPVDGDGGSEPADDSDATVEHGNVADTAAQSVRPADISNEFLWV